MQGWQISRVGAASLAAAVSVVAAQRLHGRWTIHRLRLFGALATGAVGMFLFDHHIARVNGPGLDQLVQWAPLALGLTMLMVDGFNNGCSIGRLVTHGDVEVACACARTP